MFDRLRQAPRGHKLLTKELEKKLPALGSTDGSGPLKDRLAIVKYFSPYSNWTWYGLEYCPEDKLFFGLVLGHEQEFGYFSLQELEEQGALVERDLYFDPTPIGNCQGVSL